MARNRLQNLGDRVTRLTPRITPVQASVTEAIRIRGRHLQRIRTTLLEDNPLCAECEKRGIVRLGTQCDHVVALVNGGRESLDPLDNRQMLCAVCHATKTQADLAQAAHRRTYPGGA